MNFNFSFDTAWNESQHPRGQPENAGEFAKVAAAIGLRNKLATRDVSMDLNRRIKQEGGFTYSMVTKDSPAPGSDAFAVSYSKTTERVVDADRLTCDDILDYVIDHSIDLSKPNHYLGAWVDNGKVYLDCSIVVRDEAEARKIAKENNQLAIFSFKEMKSIDTSAPS